PLLGPLRRLDLRGIDWVIVGGESGPRSRPMDPSWVYEIRTKCRRNNVPFFFKQWGGVRKAVTGRLLDGRTWDEMPSSQISLLNTRPPEECGARPPSGSTTRRARHRLCVADPYSL